MERVQAEGTDKDPKGMGMPSLFWEQQRGQWEWVK